MAKWKFRLNAFTLHSEMSRDALKSLLRHTLSPKAFEVARICEWYLGSYLPRMAAAWFVTRKPEVQGFGSEPGLSRLVNELRSLNTLAPTRMCRVMTKYASDKGKRWHNYTPVYAVLLKELRGGTPGTPLKVATPA